MGMKITKFVGFSNQDKDKIMFNPKFKSCNKKNNQNKNKNMKSVRQ
jgi:hypothetical protein